MPHSGPSVLLRTSYIIEILDDADTETMGKVIVQTQSWQSALHAIRYGHDNRRYHVAHEHMAILWTHQDISADGSR